MKKTIKIAIIILSILVIICAAVLVTTNIGDSEELKTVKSEKQLSKIYGLNSSRSFEFARYIPLIAMPGPALFSGIVDYGFASSITNSASMDDMQYDSAPSTELNMKSTQSIGDSQSTTSSESQNTSTSKDYSTTNIQVENVDEADITKTDGDYIYSLSEDKVVITNVKDPSQPYIEATITSSDTNIAPVDLLLSKNELTIISEEVASAGEISTHVEIYDITDKKEPDKEKSFEIDQEYYTSRVTNNTLYIISSGYKRTEGKNDEKKIVRTYKEDNKGKEVPLEKCKYLKNKKSNYQTYIATANLENTDEDINIGMYAMDVENAYVSENSIYLTDKTYSEEKEETPIIAKILNPKGIVGIVEDQSYEYDYSPKTQIQKFDIQKSGEIEYIAQASVEGTVINQYSMDEKEGHLRIATYNSEGTRITILDENLQKIGETPSLAEGESMYSSRFMGDKAYLVTYKNMDPLFVVDLSDETNPKSLGELKIPGYSTYLHPYDENHIIGIGMETKEVINRDISGRVTSQTAKIIGMKMALFDVSNVKKPNQISQTIIGDSRTTSAVLTNPKALLFSKEKELIAIPVNNYEEDFEIDDNNEDSTSSQINAYVNYANNQKRVSEGYFVYKINLKEGFQLKGTIVHEKTEKDNTKKYSYYQYTSRLLRGMYIENNLYTVSENYLKVNNLDTLEPVSELNIYNELHKTNQASTETENQTKGTVQSNIDNAEFISGGKE